MNRPFKYLLSCEHGGNQIPPQYAPFFHGAQEILKTHRGYDLGALELFSSFKNDQITYSQHATVSRLLVDLNRSLHRRSLLSEFTKPLPPVVRKEILDGYYHPFRLQFAREVEALWSQQEKVVHVSVHSFTPVLSGEVRHTDFGILYHPGRPLEAAFAKIWKDEIKKQIPGFRTRFNYPYLGKTDGHVAYFRKLEVDKYVGLEFEMNQKYAEDEFIHLQLSKAFHIAMKRFDGYDF